MLYTFSCTIVVVGGAFFSVFPSILQVRVLDVTTTRRIECATNSFAYVYVHGCMRMYVCVHYMRLHEFSKGKFYAFHSSWGGKRETPTNNCTTTKTAKTACREFTYPDNIVGLVVVFVVSSAIAAAAVVILVFLHIYPLFFQSACFLHFVSVSFFVLANTHTRSKITRYFGLFYTQLLPGEKN